MSSKKYSYAQSFYINYNDSIEVATNLTTAFFSSMLRLDEESMVEVVDLTETFAKSTLVRFEAPAGEDGRLYVFLVSSLDSFINQSGSPAILPREMASLMKQEYGTPDGAQWIKLPFVQEEISNGIIPGLDGEFHVWCMMTHVPDSIEDKWTQFFIETFKSDSVGE